MSPLRFIRGCASDSTQLGWCAAVPATMALRTSTLPVSMIRQRFAMHSIFCLCMVKSIRRAEDHSLICTPVYHQILAGAPSRGWFSSYA